MTSPEQFREDHGDYATWSDEVFDLYFALIADTAAHLTRQLATPTPNPAPAA